MSGGIRTGVGYYGTLSFIIDLDPSIEDLLETLL